MLTRFPPVNASRQTCTATCLLMAQVYYTIIIFPIAYFPAVLNGGMSSRIDLSVGAGGLNRCRLSCANPPNAFGAPMLIPVHVQSCKCVTSLNFPNIGLP